MEIISVMIKIRIKIVLLTSASLILPAFNLSHAMDEGGSDSGCPSKISSSSRAAAVKRRIIVSDDEGGGQGDGDAVATSRKRKSATIIENDSDDESSVSEVDLSSSDEDFDSESEESYDASHQGAYFERLIALVKSGEHDNRKALDAALGADQSTVIGCFKKALKEKRLTKEEIRPFYTSRADKNALWDGIVSLIKQNKTKDEIFSFYNERCRRGVSFSDGQFRRALQKFTEEKRITDKEARPFYRSQETKQEILDGIV